MTVRSFGGEVQCVLDIESAASIAEVKEDLAQEAGVHRARLRLLLDAAVLSDDQVLQDLGPPTELTLVVQPWKTTEVVFQAGDLVQLHYDGNVVHESLRDTGYAWVDGMNSMLGRTFLVKKVPRPGFVELPFPKANAIFPDSVVRPGEVLAEGDIVRMHHKEEVVKVSFQTSFYVWHNLMRGMLGREFRVLQLTEPGIVALPSPDGSQNGMWYFPVSVVSRVDAEADFEDPIPFK